MRRNKKNNVSDDSEYESDSEAGSSDSVATVANHTAKKKQPTPRQKRGRPPAKKNTKRQRVQDSGSDTSPQPSTSRATNGQTTPSDSDCSSESDSGSDYGPLKDRDMRPEGKKKPAPKRKVKPFGKADKKKRKTQNFVNGVSSIKETDKQSQLNTSSRKSAADSTFDANHIESLAQKLVYFLLVEDQKKYAIKRKAITAHVFKDESYSPKLYIAVIKKANFILKKIYGMELMELENQRDSYLIVNILNRELCIHDYAEVSRLKQKQHGLILYLLTIIFMNDNVITEDDLTKSLKHLGIDLTSKKLHPVFGDVKKYITVELVKQMYLTYECLSKEPPKYELQWGIRAKQEFDKKDLLQFACKIMDDATPEKWRIQFKDAEKSANPHTNGSN